MQSVSMLLGFLRELVSRKSLVFELTKRDFKTHYLGSYLGIAWAFIIPLANVFIFWFVFQIGFKSKPVAHIPYILWYIAGMIIWNFFHDCVNGGMNSIIQNSFIVKKVAFSTGILPIVKILSALVVHVFFIALVIILYIFYGVTPSIYTVQIIYYLIATILLVLGTTWFISSAVLFFRDLRQLVAIFLQFGFFMTPIFWNIEIIPGQYHIYLQLNPLYYLVQGYRDSLINKIWFWEHGWMTIYFWSITTASLVAGAVIFRRLRPHFADVL